MATGFWQPSTRTMNMELFCDCPECGKRFNPTTTVPIMSVSCHHSMCAACIQQLVMVARQMSGSYNKCKLDCTVDGCKAKNVYAMGKEEEHVNLLELSLLEEQD